MDLVLIRERPCNCGLNDEKWKIVTNYHRDTGLCRQCGGTRIDLLTLKLTDFGLSRSLLDKKP
jgi:hypothetical protein